MNNQLEFLYKQIKEKKISHQEAILQIKEFEMQPSLSAEILKTPSIIAERKIVAEFTEDLLHEKIINYLKKMLAYVIKLPVNQIEADAPMEDYGIDSVMVMQLTNELEKTFGSLSKTLFFEYQTIEALTKFFSENYREQLITLLGMEAKAAVPADNSSEIMVGAGSIKSVFDSRRKPYYDALRIEYPEEHAQTALDVAIIGISGRYPGARNVQEFWQNLSEGKDCITEIPIERWDHSLYFDADKNKPGKTYSKWGGFLEGVDQFDPLFFNISPREAEFMDPQERLFLECVFETLEDAGYTRESIGLHKGSGLEGNVGVYVGVMYEEYQLYGAQEQIQGKPIALSGSPASIANRVSYFCNFHGPSMALDTMCSSSLTAIHLACQSLQRDGCEVAIAGGVNVSIHPNKYLLLGQGKFVSSKGRCESFGEGGDGYVPGEGVGAVLLKPLAKAIADGDHIYGVIKGTAINHGGKTNGYSVPNPNAQASAIGQAIKEAGINPRTISYIEAHGTGTSLGDPIEIAGLTKTFREYTKDKQFCAIGSAKSNIGHCESAAGIAGVTKIIMQLKHQKIAPSLYSTKLNPNIDFSSSPFVVQQELTEWKRPIVEVNGKAREYSRIAGLSCFGAGGSNAHIVIEEYVDQEQKHSSIDAASQHSLMIVLSAKNEERLKEQAQRLLIAIGKQQFTQSSLTNMAYTLQVGREAMEERLAMVVGTIKELEEKLQGFVDGQDSIEDLFRGQVKRNKETLAAFVADEDLQHAIEAWISKGKYGKLLDLWVKGLRFDWNKLYASSKPCRMSLPAYPFAKERYWVPVIENPFASKAQAVSGISAVIHPLLQKNTSDIYGLQFSSTFTGKEFFLTDHVVQGQRVLPGVAYLEMVRAAVEQVAGRSEDNKTIICLKNIAWVRPLVVEQMVDVHIALSLEDRGEIAYEIYSEQEDVTLEPIMHSQGRAVLSSAALVPILDLEAVQLECKEKSLNGTECYELFNMMGLEYGPGHQGITSIYIGLNQVLAKLRLPACVADTQDQFILHPSLLDSALQATIGIMMLTKDGENTTSTGPALPFALQELVILNKCTTDMWALIRYHANNKASDKVQKLDIDLCDEQGNVCLRIKGFSSRVLNDEAGTARTSLASKTLMLAPGWQEQAMQEVIIPAFEQHIVLLCEVSTISRESIENGLSGVRCYKLKSGHAKIDERFQTYAVQVFAEIKALLQGKPQGNVLVQIITSSRGEQALFAGLAGLLKTAQLENPKIMGQLIEIEEDSSRIIEILTENSHSPVDHHIRYQGGKRLVAYWKEIEMLETANLPWKDHGIYLITGGAGGLGQIVANEIVHKVKNATLILTGRSTLSDAKKAELKKLEVLGARVEYQEVDVTSKQAVRDLLQNIQEKFGSLQGIIHSAGVIRDNFIIKKDPEELQVVLAPKVTGLVNLDQASQKLPLEFFIVFSSMAGVLGNLGQADYSTGNAFMDSYANYRNTLVLLNERQGRTLSINWPLWKDGGMHIDRETEKMMGKTTGMSTMETSTGILALYQSVASSKSQVMVMEGNVKKLRATFLERPARPEVVKAVPYIEEKTMVQGFNHDLLQEKAISYFKKLLSIVIKLPANKIDADAQMENYGIDSVMIMQLTNQLEKTFGSLSKTLFFEYHTIDALTKYFLEAYREPLMGLLGIEEKAAATVENSMELIAQLEPVKLSLSSRRHSRFAAIHAKVQKEQAPVVDIAIIGVSGRYPGARNVQEFWQNLSGSKDCITEIPIERWDHSLYFDSDKSSPGKTYTKWGGFLDGVDEFDPLFFNISPREAIVMDPQERLFLECVYETLEDAGYTRESIDLQPELGLGGNVGVYVGVMYEEYQLYGAQQQVLGRPIALAGISSSIANRVSYFCNFHGPSMALNTMCSSSLTAIHLACQSLQQGGCEFAIAGGVNVSIHPNKYLLLGQGKFVSSKGLCESFGEGGDGYVPGEGVGAVLLKPLSKAISDGDHIYGIIKGTAINHGGKTNGYSVPNPNAQATVIQRAFKAARVDPRTISYIEAHGTGTSLGDPIEIAGLTKTFQQFTQDKGFCAIGSAKSNIGHCESAAGIAGLTKIILQLKHQKLVPSLHSKTLNPNIDFASTPFVVQQELEEWKRPEVEMDGRRREYPRIAGISAFGAGGSNAHVVIEEYIPQNENRPLVTVSAQEPVIIVLSAKNADRLLEQIQRLATAIKEQKIDDTSLADMAYTLQIGREGMEERIAVIVGSIKELEDKLSSFIQGQQEIDKLYQGQVSRNKETLSVFTTDEDMTTTIDAWINKKKYGKLLDLWVKGLNFDWNKLYSGKKPLRISLPTYSFAKERYWLPKIESQSNSNLISSAGNEFTQSLETEKIILVKDWKQQNITAKHAIQAGVIVVLGTVTTKDIVASLFDDIAAIKVIQVIHGKNQSSNGIFADFYDNLAGEELYKQLIEKLNEQKLIGVIDITACDSAYEQSIRIETGKIAFLQKMITHVRSEGCQLLQVTHCLQAFKLTQSTMQGARLAGLYRMLGAEYKQVKAMTMDSDYKVEESKELKMQIESEFFNKNEKNSTECCYRSSERYEPYLTASQTSDDIKGRLYVPQQYEKHDVVLITGGSRGIGATIAEHVILQGAKNIVIMGRDDLPKQSAWQDILKTKDKSKFAEKIKRLQSYINQGVNVQYFCTSLTDQDGLSEMVSKIHEEMGPITGVFHCAGCTSENPAFFKKTISDIEAVCEPKIAGLVTLYQALGKEPLGFFILFSSLSSVIPTLSAGQSDYAMANAYMDYYAQYKAGHGKTYFKAIQWPAWSETGMASGGIRTPAYMKTGFVSLTTKQGLKFLDSIKKSPHSVSLPCLVVPSEFCSDQLLLTEELTVKKVDVARLQQISNVQTKTSLIQGSPMALRTIILRWLQNIFIAELQLKVDQFDEYKPFDEYGVDSVILVQLTKTMQEQVSTTLNPALFLEHSTIFELTNYFVKNHGQDFEKDLEIEAVSHVVEAACQESDIAMSNEPVQQINTEIDDNNNCKSAMQVIHSDEEIAIVGLSCRLPGSPTKEEYWNLLNIGLPAIKPVSKERWISKDNRLDYGGWVDDIDLFDPNFFYINEKDVAIMDPQARILLEESLKAIYDAGYEHKQLSGQKIGVYIGGRSQPSADMNTILQAPNPILGLGQNYMATNISRFFNFRGPSMVVDTACSSGITSLLLASDALRAGRTDMALVGAVSLLLNPVAYDMFAARNILSENGEFHIFDKRSNGEVLGEGAGIVILKRLSDAIKDGNHIYSVIKAIAVNNDGRTLGPGSPNIKAQRQVIKEALVLSGKQVADIGYIEVNGGGSPIVDSIEIKALADSYQLNNKVLPTCYIGSVKPNIGHLLLASGLAGFMRCVLSVYHKQIPPFLSAVQPFEHFDFSASRISCNRETINWKVEPGKKRVAAQSSFPDGGTNCHVIIEEFTPDKQYIQQCFPKQIPNLVKKHFPIFSLSATTSPTVTTVAGQGEYQKNSMYNFKENQNHLPIKNVWGKYDEENI